MSGFALGHLHRRRPRGTGSLVLRPRCTVEGLWHHHWLPGLRASTRRPTVIQSTNPNRRKAPREPHTSNVIMNNHWRDDKHDVRKLVEGGHILHGKADVWASRYCHYHSGLSAGENTLNAQVARVVMRSLAEERGVHNVAAFLERYKELLTTPGAHNDSYAEAFHRQLMSNHLLRGAGPKPEHATPV